MTENKQLAKSVFDDLESRQRSRRSFELKWLLSMNYLAGNQYYEITPRGEVEDSQKSYDWECREVFNHIAPIMEVRLSKLARFRPKMSVRPSGGSDDDLLAAKMSTKILDGVAGKIHFQSVINEANKWSEVCGTSFYKVVWDKNQGLKIAEGKQEIFEGDIKVVAVSPFEIYPENSTTEDIDCQKSIIHAKAYTVSDIENIWGLKVTGKDINVNTLQNLGTSGYLGSSIYTKFTDKQVMHDSEIVVEKYCKPDKDYKNGRLIIVCGDYILYDGELPYFNKSLNQKGYPFIRQVAIPQVGCFWGISIIERLIPIQRAYNSVKCRKYEFMSRISMGILRVEDGSIDTENLQDEGLCPGKILVYRQGSTPPQIMENMSVPLDFLREEERLLNEFILISGVSELLRAGRIKNENMSGVALQILSEQDDTRLVITLDSLKIAVKEVAKQALMLYKQFAETERLLSIGGAMGEVEVLEFSKNSISSFDVVYETDNEIEGTLAQRRVMAFDLLKSGLLHDSEGKISERMRGKVLDILGFGGWEYSQDLSQAHIAKAQFENENIKKHANFVEIDDHNIHIAEHTKRYLSEQMKGRSGELDAIMAHINEHKNGG